MLRYPTKVAVFAIAISTAAHAQTADSEAARFGAREGIVDISISPDGSRIAVVVPRPSAPGEGILVVPLDGGKTMAIPGSNGGDEKLHYCHWSTEARLVCAVNYVVKDAGRLLGYSRIVAVSADGSGARLLTPKTASNSYFEVQSGGQVIDLVSPDGGNSVLMTHDVAPQMTTGNFTARGREGRSVISIDTVSGKFRQVETPRPSAAEYISDGQGQVRIMGTRSSDSNGYMSNRSTYSFRPAGSRDWQTLSVVESDGTGSTGFVPHAVDSKLDVVYGFAGVRGGFSALFKQQLAPGTKPELVLGRNDVDVDGLVRIGREQRVVGVSYATDKRFVEFFDPELKALSASLRKVLPAGSQVSFVDASAGENKLVLLVSSDTNPGVFYLYDKQTRKLGELLPVRPELAGMKLAEQKPITFPAADGTPIPGYLTLPPGSDGKNLPAIVMPHGGPSARDEWGFDWFSQYFASKGFAVLQPNYRGSSGYGSGFFQQNGFKSWRTAIGDVNDAGRWLASQGIAAPGKLAIVGWSYGGYAALQSAVVDPDLFKAIVAVAPVTDLKVWRDESATFSNAKIMEQYVGDGPHLQEGSPARHAAMFKAPVLLFHGDMDQNVGVGESRTMAQQLKSAGKSVEYVEFKGLDHQLDESAARTRLLSQSAAFLKSVMGL